MEVFNSQHKNIGIDNCGWGTHCSPIELVKNSVIKLKKVIRENESHDANEGLSMCPGDVHVSKVPSKSSETVNMFNRSIE